MNHSIKKKLPVTSAAFEKKNKEILSEIKGELQKDRESQNKVNKALEKNLSKELTKIKDTNVLMNSNTNSHIEEVKKQIANSIDSKFEYTKKQIDVSKENTDYIRHVFDIESKRMSGIESTVNKTLAITEKNGDVLNKLDGLYKLIEKSNKDFEKRLERVEMLLEMNKSGVTEKKREQQIVVSFTSYGKRISTVPLMLDRLFNQTLKPDRIIMYLSKDNFPGLENDLPERLLEMRQFGLEIRWCDGDIKSYKKIIPALKEFPNDIIITVDDDLYFELDLVEKLYDSYKKYPKAISASRVHRMHFNEDKTLKPYNSWDNEYSELVGIPAMDLFPTTGAGVLFPPHVLNEEVFNEEQYRKLCPNADDIWMKFIAIISGVPTVLIEPYKGLYCIQDTQNETLWKLNREENDMQINRFLQHYKSYFDEISLYDRIINS